MEWNWWVLIVVPIAWILQNIVHELSHVLAGRYVYGATKLRIYPWPHRHNGRFFFSRYSFKLSSLQEAFGNEPDLRSSIHFAPVGGAAVFVALAAIIMLILPEAWKILVFPFWVAPIIDVLVWEWGYHFGSEGCDGKRYKYMKEWEED